MSVAPRKKAPKPKADLPPTPTPESIDKKPVTAQQALGWKADLMMSKEHWAAFFEVARCASLEVSFYRDRSELVSKTIDPSHVILAVSKIRTALGIESLPEQERIGFDVEVMQDQLRPFYGTEPVHLRFGSKDPKELILQADGTTAELQRLDVAGIMDPKVPKGVGTWSGYVDAHQVGLVLREAQRISDHVTLRPGVHSDVLEFVAKGEVTGWSRPVRVQRPTGSFRSSMYPLDLLRRIVEAVLTVNAGVATITVEIADHQPIKIGADMPFGETIFLLAPRVE